MRNDSPQIFIRKTRKKIKTTKTVIKTEMDHDETDGERFEDKINEWLLYVKNVVLCTAFSYARYTKATQELTGFSIKDCLSIPGLSLKYFKSLRTEEDGPIYTYNDK